MTEQNVIPDNNKVKKVFTLLSLLFLFIGTILVYIFAGFNFLYIYATVDDPGPDHFINRIALQKFFANIDYGRTFRYDFLYIIIAVFLISLFLLLIKNKEIKELDTKARNKTVIIHDDVIQVVPEKIKDNKLDYHPEKFVPEGGYQTIDELFHRKGFFRIFMKVANYLCIPAIGLILWVFFRQSSLAPPSIYYYNLMFTDEGHMMIDLGLIYLMFYFILRCPDFVKGLAATGFKRIYLRRLHIHETFVGLLLALGGLLLILNSDLPGSYFDRMTGITILILGIFMIGRDWKDFVEGKFLSD